MEKRKILKYTIIGGCVTALVILVGLMQFRGRQTTPASQTPEEKLEVILKENIKEEFLPLDFKLTPFEKIIAEGKLNILPGVATRKIADLYFKDWTYENAYFTVYLAYDKNSKDFVGYDIGIRIKEPELKDKELAQRYLKNVPPSSWKHGGPVHRSGLWEYDKEISSIVFSKGKARVYLSIVLNKYVKPHKVSWPEETYVQKAGIVNYVSFMPGNPDYERVYEIQKHILWGYGD